MKAIYQNEGKDVKALSEDELKLRYKVPFVIWANYEIEHKTGLETSSNFLGGYVLEIAQTNKSPYFYFLDTIQNKLPIISAINCIGENEEVINYQKMQYYMMHH